MGEAAQQLPFRVVLQDDGSIKLQGFENQLKKTTGVAGRSGNKMTRAFSRIGRGIRAVGRSVFSLKGLLIGLAGGVVIRTIGRVVGSILRTADAADRARLRLVGMKGGIDEANAAFANFERIAGQVPFTLTAITEAGVTLEAFGAKSEDTLSNVADLAAFMGLEVPEAAAAFGRAFAAGAGAADILRERGVLTLVSLRTGIQDLTKLSLPEFREALLSAMRDPTGPIADAAKLLAGTFSGQVSMMTDAIETFARKFAEAGLTDLAKELVQNFTTFSKVFLASFEGNQAAAQAFFQDLRTLIPSAKTLVSVGFTLVRAFQRVVIVFRFVDSTLKSATLGVQLIRLGLVTLVDFISRVAVGQFVLLAKVIIGSLNRSLKAMQEALREAGNALRNTEKVGVAKLGRGMLALSGTIGNASNAMDKQQERLTGLGKEQLKMGDSVKTAARAVELARLETAKSIRALNLSQRAFEQTGTAAEQAARSIDMVTKAQQAQAAAAPEAAAVKPITGAELRELFGQEELIDLFTQLSTARQQQLRQDEEFVKASTKRQLEIVKNSVQAEADFRRTTQIKVLGDTAKLVGGIASFLEASGNASFKTLKKFRIAEAIISGIAAVQGALASPPGPPFTIPLAAAIAAQTAANVAAIRSAQPGGGAGGGAGSVSGGAAAVGGGPAAPGEIEPVATAAERTGPSNINITVSGFVGDQGEFGRRIVDLVRVAQGDGSQIEPVT